MIAPSRSATAPRSGAVCPSRPSLRRPRNSVRGEAEQIRIASALIELDARLQVLEAETSLSREKLLKLYKELRGKSPPKGMLPFSTDWFMTWQPNIHGSLFMNLYQSLLNGTEIDPVDAEIHAYRLYLEHTTRLCLPTVLSLTRAWRLVKFCESGMIRQTTCSCCGGTFLVQAFDLTRGYVCGLCHMPARAGKCGPRGRTLPGFDGPAREPGDRGESGESEESATKQAGALATA